jgi:hypothetical protein
MSLQVQTQTLQINNVPADKMQVLIERATALGRTPEEYALRLIVEGLEPREKTITEWYGRMEEAEPFPDLDYWLSQNDAAKFEAAWEMVIEAHQIKGEDIRESRLQRSVGGLQRRER